MVTNNLKIGGKFFYELIRRGRVIDIWESKNIVTNEGRNYLLGQTFGVVSKVSAWYVGLYTATAGNLADLTGADIGGSNLTEFTGYVGNRPEYLGALSYYTWSNAVTKAQFSISVNATIKGSFLANDDIGACTRLLSIDAFASGDRAVSPSDTLNVTYVFGMSNA